MHKEKILSGTVFAPFCNSLNISQSNNNHGIKTPGYTVLTLFDIDKTPLASSCHCEAFSDAFKKVYGSDANIDIIEHNGMTDKPDNFRCPKAERVQR